MPLSNLPGPWRWEKRGDKWWRIHDGLDIEDGPHSVRTDEEDEPDHADLVATAMGMEIEQRRQSMTGELERTEWVEEQTGYRCVAFLNMMEVWVGYVEVPPEHPWFGWSTHEYDESATFGIRRLHEHDAIDELHVHGGITFCGIPAGCEEGTWWFGFDCNHAWDISPGLDRQLGALGFPSDAEIYAQHEPWMRPTFKDLSYVKGECSLLAAQLAAILQGEGVGGSESGTATWLRADNGTVGPPDVP